MRYRLSTLQLKELLDEIKTLNAASAAPAKWVEDLSRDARDLVEESARPEPRAKRYAISLDGLKEAAQAIGGIAEPILSLVAKISALLLGA